MPAPLHRPLVAALLLLSAMIAHASPLHPIKSALPDAEMSFLLQHAACPDETVVLTLEYRPRREWDVRKQRHLHLLDGVFRVGRDILTTNREEAHVLTRELKAEGTTLRFSVPLRDPEADHSGYQLAAIQAGDVAFERWFEKRPVLAPGFGLECTDDALRGTARLAGLGALPLGGKLPLWPELRAIELDVARVRPPVIRLWDPMARHHWDGWRQSTPERWPGGSSVVGRHVASPTVWREHEYDAVAAEGEGTALTPRGVMPGVELEVFWPEGDSLEFPDTQFDEMSVASLRVSRLTPRGREILVRSVERRPGLEMNTVSAEEWQELLAIAADDKAFGPKIELRRRPDGQGFLVAHREDLEEPWLFMFAAGYDAARRFKIHTLLLTPARWAGPLPE